MLKAYQFGKPFFIILTNKIKKPIIELNKYYLHKNIITLFLTFFLFANVLGQNKHGMNKKHPELPLFIETHIFPAENIFNCVLSYKIPYSNVLFVKGNSYYSSGYTISFEIYEKEKFVKRIYSSNKIVVDNYSETLSENIYSEGVTSLNITKGKYIIKPSIILNNTAIEARIKPIDLLVDSTQIYAPIFVKDVSQFCDSLKYQLVNFQNSIPFSDEQYHMLIPSFSENEKSIYIEITQQNKSIIKTKINDYIYLNEKFESCNGKLIINKNSNLPFVKFFRVNLVNQKLDEGDVKLKVEVDSKNLEFQFQVLWFEKPISLFNIEEAIKHLKIIGLNTKADSLLNYPDEEQYDVLYNFWAKYDDDTTTAFNSVFTEFYSRIDFVKREFNSLGKKDALETDRGKTYINYGKPDKIIRTFNEIYDVIEVWEYIELNEKFYFSDKTGTGKFERMK